MSDETSADGGAGRADGGSASAAAPVQSDVAFPRLSEAQLAAVAAAGTPRELIAGETLSAPGDMDYDLVVVLSGRVAILDGAGTPAESVVAIHRARQFAGELNLITSEPAYMTAVVEESGEGISLSRDALRSLVSRDQPLGDLILTALVARRSLLVETGSGVRLVGSGRSPRSRELREFLTRNRVPHSFTELEADPGGEALVRELTIVEADLPLLISGATVLRNPTIIEAANALNLRHPNKTARVPWDLVIVGGGPGGLGAAVYAATEGLRTILVDAIAVGGQASTSSRIENYLGFPAGVSGSDLADRAAVQARRFGLRTAVPERAEALVVEDGHYVVQLDSGDELAGRTIVLATGPATASCRWPRWTASTAPASTTPPPTSRRRCAAAIRSRSSAAATQPARRRSSSPARSAGWRCCCAAPTLPPACRSTWSIRSKRSTTSTSCSAPRSASCTAPTRSTGSRSPTTAAARRPGSTPARSSSSSAPTPAPSGSRAR